MLVDEVQRLPEIPEWLEDAATDWDVAATAHYGFGVPTNLDVIVTDDARCKLMLHLCHAAWDRIVSWGDPVDTTTLNGLRDWGHGYSFRAPVNACILLRPALFFTKLLRGDLTPEECDARWPDSDIDACLHIGACPRRIP